MKKRETSSNMCGINLRLAKIKNFVKKERDQSNMCGINLRLVRF